MATPHSYDDKMLSLVITSRKSLNFGGPVSADSIIVLCSEIETLARTEADSENLPLIEMISVNALCVKGDMGLAVNKAQKMYEEAVAGDSRLGMAYAIQAIGCTFMHSNQYVKARSTFAEAESQFLAEGDVRGCMRLMINQLHVFYSVRDTVAMRQYIGKAKQFIDIHDLLNEQDFVFYILCYQTLYDIEIGDAVMAMSNINKLYALDYPHDEFYKRWYYFVMSRYYALDRKYDDALMMTDSTLSIVKVMGSGMEYRNSLVDKALLLARMNRNDEAADIYALTVVLSDSIGSRNYNRQMESLHMAYWVDKMKIENMAAHNKLLIQIVLLSILVLAVGVFLILRVRRKNTELEISRAELTRIKEAASESIQSKSLFLSNMSHDLRTPLNAIVGFSGILTDTEDVDAETRHMCGEYIKQNSDLLLKLFNDIIDLSSLNENKMSFTFENCDIVPLCRNVIDTVDNVKKTSAEMQFVSSVDSLKFITDSGRLQQVLINLLVNATKFTEQGHIRLTLDVDAQTNEAVFTIEDTGCGIPLERQPRIFERFEKLHESVQGVGLGLSICRLIVERVGGRIWIDSEYTGGARFVFTHPMNKTR